MPWGFGVCKHIFCNQCIFLALPTAKRYAYMRGMTQDVLRNYEMRAFAARVSMTELCKRAGVASSTITRWRKGKKPWAATLIKLDHAIDAIERERAA